jgi:hypothetical protein
MLEQQLSSNPGIRRPELPQPDPFLFAATQLACANTKHETLSEMTQRICERHLGTGAHS